MPKVGISVESCVLTKWHKKKGDSVKKGDVLFTYETDKSTIDFESEAEGKILEVFFEAGADVPVMLNVCVIGKEGEAIEEFKPAPNAACHGDTVPDPACRETCPHDPAAARAPQAGEALSGGQRVVTPSSAELKISPRAKVLAQKTGVDISYAVPTGAEGRIVERDIAALADRFTPAAGFSANAAEGTGIGGKVRAADNDTAVRQHSQFSILNSQLNNAPEFYEEKAANIRKVIAKAMQESLSSMAQLTLNASFDAANILAFRAMVKEKGKDLGLPNITLNDIVLFAVSRVLTRHKYVKANFSGDAYKIFNTANIGIAVDTEKGLLVPTLFNADKKSLSEISKEAKVLAEAAQKGSISPDKLKGGSFTVTNLGALGVESFTPVINPPQTAILGVCNITERVKAENGQLKTYQAMGLSLTFDHRAFDGAPAARFLQDLCKTLESFTLLLI